MKTNRSSGRLIGLGVLSAIAASLCCITPVLALIAGSAGITSTFSWLEPARPYLVGITVAVLAFAWYQQLRPKKENAIACTCEGEEAGSSTIRKSAFWKSKAFLGIVTVFAGLMLAFPYYGKVFYPKAVPKVEVVQSADIQQAHIQIAGMTCSACEQEVKHAVAGLHGYMDASVNYKTGVAIVKYDRSKTSLLQVDSAVNSTGYKVVPHETVTKQSISRAANQP